MFHVLTAWEPSVGNVRAGTQKLPRHPGTADRAAGHQPLLCRCEGRARLPLEAFFKKETKF